MSAAPPAPPRKPLKLRLDTAYGPAPSLAGKYRSAANFKQMYRGYQWTQGLCPFSITARYTIFTHPELAGQGGFYVAPEGFHAAHDHAAPFVPLNVDAENARLAQLERGDPEIDSPPLMRAASGAGGAARAPVASSSSADGAARPSPTFAGDDNIRGTSSSKRLRVAAQAPPAPGPPPGPPSTASAPREFALPSSRASSSSAAQPPTERSSAPHATPQVQPAQQTSAAARSNPFLPPPRPSPSAVPPPSPSPALGPSLTPLGSYLSLISPSLVQHLALLARGGLPASTPGSALVELDSGADGDRAVLELVRDAAGEGMKFFEAVLVADGTRKAKRRGRIEVGWAAVAAREAA
ncbi:hypothetical protein JCM9279_001945 [Rhodotorula babjevae]